MSAHAEVSTIPDLQARLRSLMPDESPLDLDGHARIVAQAITHARRLQRERETATCGSEAVES